MIIHPTRRDLIRAAHCVMLATTALLDREGAQTAPAVPKMDELPSHGI
jgi:hypothetical protein